MVKVLLSTFNAGEHLMPLLQSVWSQEDVEVLLHVRDDGSTDGTREAVAHLVQLGAVAVDLGSHVGPCRSYFSLLTTAGVEGEYVALCDQDDVWLPGKLSRAVSLLEGSARRPSMYCGRLVFTDFNLNSVGLSPVPRRRLSLSNALVENVALGPTIVMNARGWELIATEVPDYAVMHDAWAYVVFSALGTILYDVEPHLLYRIHDRNHVGIQRNRLVRLYRAARYRLGDYMSDHINQAREFERLFGDEIGNDDKAVLTRFCEDAPGWSSALGYALKPGVYRQSESDDFILRAVSLGWRAGWGRAKDRERKWSRDSQIEGWERQCP